MDEDFGIPPVRDDKRRDTQDDIEDKLPPPNEILDLTVVYEALAHSRRRYVVHSFLFKPRWTLRELATALASWEQSVPEDEVAEVDHDEVYVSLYHTHVPKLIQLNVLKFEEGDEEAIVASNNAAQVLAILDGIGASHEIAHIIGPRGPSVDRRQDDPHRTDCSDR